MLFFVYKLLIGLEMLGANLPQHPKIDVRNVRFLSVPALKVNGKLGLTGVGGEEPLHEVLVFVPKDGKEAQRVFRLEELKGRVAILNRESALQYIRLLTSPFTFRGFSAGREEVVSYSWIDKQFFYGNERVYKHYGDATGIYYGHDGILAPAISKKLGVSPPVVQEIESGYRITRTLFEEKGFPQKVTLKAYRVVEIVGKEGSYRVEKEWEIPSKGWGQSMRITRLK